MAFKSSSGESSAPRSGRGVAAAFAIAITAACLASPVAHAAELALKRVMLSTGVAYLEHEAQVTGDAELSLDVPLDAVDDVLKSIVVYDSKGGVGSARLPGRNPLSQLFKDLPFGEEALASPAALLNALQGAEVKVGSSHPVTGKLLRVVQEVVAAAGERAVTTRNRVSVLTSTGLQQFILEDADNISFADAGLQAKVDKALTEIAAYRAKGRREIVLSTHGVGERTLRIGYVVAAPLWKASFRLTLPQDPAATKAQLQGWAVLENMSGQDWNGVELTLLSGDPVSFRQAIYQAYYVTRPEVPVEVLGRVLPRPDSGAVSPAPLAKAETTYDQLKEQHRVRTATVAGAEAARPAAPPLTRALNPSGGLPVPASIEPELPSRPVDTAEALEGVTQVAFRLPVPVSVASGQSAIVPIVDRDVPVERLALFQPDVSGVHPLASLRLRNDTGVGLPPGVVTLYEQTPGGIAYVGDARLSGLPAGESRLASYAVDEKTKVVRSQQTTSTLARATVGQGVLRLTRTKRDSTTYQIAAPASETRRLVIEHAKRGGWSLVAPTGVEETASAYRVAADLKAGEAKALSVVLETPETESLEISDMEDSQVAAFATDRELEAGIRKAFGDLARLRRALAEDRSVEEKLKGDIEALQTDQARIRENIARVDKDHALHKRYLEKLSDQETRFEALQTASAKAADATRAAEAAVAAYIAAMGG